MLEKTRRVTTSIIIFERLILLFDGNFLKKLLKVYSILEKFIVKGMIPNQ